MSLAFRPADAGDQRFIVDSWVSSYRKAHTAGLIQMDDWYAVMIPQVEKVLRRPDVRTLVAYETAARDRVADLYGFITADTAEHVPLVYYVFVKVAYRRAGGGRLWGGPGLARQLFDAIGVDPDKPFAYVCSTPWVRQLARKIPLARWTPLAGRYPKHEERTTER